MASFNKVILAGNLTRDIEIRYTSNSAAVAEIGLAVNRKWFDKQTKQQKEEATFVDVTLWGKNAENASQYLQKGSSLLIEGRLQLDQWDDKQTGQKRSKLRVVCESMQFLGGARTQGNQQPTNQGGQRQNSPHRTAQQQPPQQRQPQSQQGQMFNQNEGVPF